MTEVTSIRPKESLAILKPVNNTYAVRNGMLYDYYSIKLGEATPNGKFVPLVKSPPLMKEGFVTFNKKLFKVTLRDLFRRQINVQREYQCGNTAGTSSSTRATTNQTQLDQTSNNSDQQRLSADFELQVNEAADLYWKDQIATLLFTEDPEAEWGMEELARSLEVNAYSSISNIDKDSGED